MGFRLWKKTAGNIARSIATRNGLYFHRLERGIFENIYLHHSYLPELINGDSQRLCILCRGCLLFFFGNNTFLLVFLLGDDVLVGTHNVNGRFLRRRMRENWKRKKWDGRSVTISCDNRNAANGNKRRYVLNNKMGSAPFIYSLFFCVEGLL